MSDFLYRYIGFDTFVDMVQSESLAFVLPSVWEDPRELHAVKNYIQQQEDIITRLFLLGILDKTYAQCWSQLEESDAMWRIYSYAQRALRIKVRRDSFCKLNPEIIVKDVIYTNEIDESIATLVDIKNNLMQLWSYKRKAFEHEKETRVILPYKYPDEEAVEEHIRAYVGLYSDDSAQQVSFIESFKKGSIKENIEYAAALTNANKRDAVRKVPFSHCVDFIQGVLVHPLAPSWYVETVRTFCENNGIPFEGKSTLYQR